MSGIAYSLTTAPGEVYYLWEPVTGARAGRRLILFHHGTGGETMIIEPTVAARSNARAVLAQLVSLGYAILSCDYGGAQTFGNTNNMTKISAALTWAAGLGFRTDKVGLIGESMGHSSLYVWGCQNPSKVAALVGYIPGADLDSTYANMTGFATVMDAAFAPSTWAAQSATHNPVELAAPSWASHWAGFYASDDPTYGAQGVDVTALAAHIGNSAGAVDTGPGGHTDAGLADPGVQEDFIDVIENGAW